MSQCVFSDRDSSVFSSWQKHSLLVGVEHKDPVASGHSASDVRQLGAGVQAVVDDQSGNNNKINYEHKRHFRLKMKVVKLPPNETLKLVLKILKSF